MVAACTEAHEEQVLAEGSEAEERSSGDGRRSSAECRRRQNQEGTSLNHLIPRYGAPIDQQPGMAAEGVDAAQQGWVICPCTPCRTKGLGKWVGAAS